MVRDCWDSVPSLTLIWSKWYTHLIHLFLFLQKLRQHLLGGLEALPLCLLVSSDKKALGVLIVSTFENKSLWTYLGYLCNQRRHCGANELEIISRQWLRKYAFPFSQSEFYCHHLNEAGRVLFLWFLPKSGTAFFKNGTNHHSALGILWSTRKGVAVFMHECGACCAAEVDARADVVCGLKGTKGIQ